MVTHEDRPRFFGELRRRRVLSMTAIYIVTAWVMVQVASEAFPALNILAIIYANEH